MAIIGRLYDVDPWYTFCAGLVLLLVAGEVGRRIGLAGRQRGDAGAGEITTLESASLTLLALLIGFTLSMALSRFDTRKETLLNEANAIGTAALRARLLPEPQAGESRTMLRDYVQIQIDLIGMTPSPAQMRAAIDRSGALQEQLWQRAMAASKADPRSIASGLFVQALNDVIDLQEKRIIAATNHVPEVVFLLLYGIATVAVGFSGYAAGLDGRRGRVPSTITIMLLATVIGLVNDIDHPTNGLVVVSQKPMLDLVSTLDSVATGVPRPASSQ